MPENQEKQVQVRLRRSLVDPRLAPKPAHSFVWTRVGADITLEIGYFDLPEIRSALERARAAAAVSGVEPSAEVTLFVTDRFTMTPQGVGSLLQVAEELKRDLTNQGLWPPPVPVGPSKVN